MEAFQAERNSLWRELWNLDLADHLHAQHPITHYRRGKTPKKHNKGSLNVLTVCCVPVFQRTEASGCVVPPWDLESRRGHHPAGGDVTKVRCHC